MAYSDQYTYLLPLWLHNNVTVAAVGNRAKETLLKYRPQYRVQNLLYYLPLFSHNGKNQKILPEVDPDTITFAVVGTLEQRKGQDVLLKAIEMMPYRDLANSRFIFVGNNQEKDIGSLVIKKTEELPGKVIYIPQIERNEVPAFYEQIDCLICASRDDPMPIVVTEACQLGKVIICSENTGSASLIEVYNAGLVYHDDSSAELAELLSRVSRRDIPDGDSMITAAKKLYKEQFSEKAFSEKLDSLLQIMTEDDRSGIEESNSEGNDLKYKYLLETANSAITELRKEKESLESALREQQNAITQLKDLTAQQQNAITLREAELEALFSSTIWRITSPLRSAGSIVKKRLKNSQDD